MSRSRGLSARAPIYGALRAANGPLTAYQILDAVREHGITAPPTVYRALNRLVDEGLAHRVESLNAYVACAHSHHGEGSAAVFAICENCGMVTEFEAGAAAESLRVAATEVLARVDRMTVELRGLCRDCGSDAPSTRDWRAHGSRGDDHEHD